MASPDNPCPTTAGRVSRIQRACTGDGPGYRTTVFLQGCPLHCPWCHNPDYRPTGPLVSRNLRRCIGCGRCVETASGCHRGKPRCDGCGVCVAGCPAGALTLLGAEIDVEAVMRVVRRDAPYYAGTGGGMTLSGGEPLAQMDFALALLDAARREGIAGAIETACAIPRREFARVVGRADLYLCDIKASRAAYPALVGADPDIILANIAALSAAGCEIVIRVPCVAGVNVDDGLAAFVAEAAALPRVRDVELLPYHDMGRGKAVMAGLDEADWSAMRAPTPEELEALGRRMRGGETPQRITTSTQLIVRASSARENDRQVV